MNEYLQPYYNRGTKAEHGTHARYGFGCHCEDCKQANADYKAARREAKEEIKKRKTAQHGTRSMYVLGCRLECCAKANRDYQREWMALKSKGIEWNDPFIDF